VRKFLILISLAAALLGGSVLAGCGSTGSEQPAGKHRQGEPQPGMHIQTLPSAPSGKSSKSKSDGGSSLQGFKSKAKKKVKVAAYAGGDKNCDDFKTQRQAQQFESPGDPSGLDADGDGRACASLPCPCADVKVDTSNSPAAVAGRRHGPSYRTTVLSVADGDTINVAKPGGGEETVRMLGIDTPEVYGGVECGGPRASAEMKKLAVGRVTVTTDPTQDRRDRYGRLLAYINKGSEDLGQRMVAMGLASVYAYDGYFQRFNAYNRAENRATAVDRGSWAHCDITAG